MKVVIMGSGGIGGYYGGCLAAAGHDITFVARGPHLEALRTKGLRVERKEGDLVLPPQQATDDPASIAADPPVELVLVATKDYGLAAAAQALKPVVGPATAVVPLLNGVDAAQRLGAELGMERMLGGVAMISSTLVAPGHVRRNSDTERLTFGEFSGERTPRALAIEAALRDAGVNVALSDEISVELWKKFVFLVPVATIASVTRGAARAPDDPDRHWLREEAMREIERIAHARGIALPESLVDTLLGRTVLSGAGTKPSMLVDLEAGRPLELEATSGAVVRMGQEAGIPTPVNRTLYAALKPYADGAA